MPNLVVPKVRAELTRDCPHRFLSVRRKTPAGEERQPRRARIDGNGARRSSDSHPEAAADAATLVPKIVDSMQIYGYCGTPHVPIPTMQRPTASTLLSDGGLDHGTIGLNVHANPFPDVFVE